MRCRKCGRKAAINMRQHRLALCKDHYLEWIPEQTQRSIKKYHMFDQNERIMVAVSGGKDSLALWDILIKLNYQVDGLYIDLGIDDGIGYSEESKSIAQKFADENNSLLRIFDVVEEYGESIPGMAENTRRGRGKPCSVCGLTKRHIMNKIARDEGYDVLVTGHNLDDEAAVLFGNTLNWAGGYLIRQGPLLEASHSGLVRKAKPLCRFYEREMAAYALLRGIEYVYDECPYSIGSKSIYYKELLNQLENDRPGAKLNFYLSFLRSKQNGLFADTTDDIVLNTCSTCGQPTSAPGECAFCRMLARLEKMETT